MERNEIVRCTRCRNVHKYHERVEKKRRPYKGLEVFDIVCPRCGCHSFYSLNRSDKA